MDVPGALLAGGAGDLMIVRDAESAGEKIPWLAGIWWGDEVLR